MRIVDRQLMSGQWVCDVMEVRSRSVIHTTDAHEKLSQAREAARAWMRYCEPQFTRWSRTTV